MNSSIFKNMFKKKNNSDDVCENYFMNNFITQSNMMNTGIWMKITLDNYFTAAQAFQNPFNYISPLNQLIPNYMMYMMNQNNDTKDNKNNSFTFPQNEDNQNESKNKISVFFKSDLSAIKIIQANPRWKIWELINNYRVQAQDYDKTKEFFFNSHNLESFLDKTLSEAGITHHTYISVSQTKNIKGVSFIHDKEINIKFIKSSTNCLFKDSNCQLNGLLKLSLLKEISSNLNIDELKKLPKIISNIMKLLKIGYIKYEEDIKDTIEKVLIKFKGINIINFSEFVDEIIDTNQLDKIIKLLDKNEFEEINDIRFRLSKYNKYMKFFMKEFDETKKKSIFEFSVISLVVIEREDFEKFEKEREKCSNRVDRILYHGTSVKPICSILNEHFKKSVDKCYQHGKGVYFTDLLDYCWFYGNEKDNRANINKIPQINQIFTLIASYVYYDREMYKKVINEKFTPKKNGINFAYADAETDTLNNCDSNKFFGTEYVIWDLDQICPFISAKLKRIEYCVIWRDNNFSPNPVYYNQFDKIFKKFLNERKKYIKQLAKYNIYPCETSEEALKLVERKKYNKIILISNVGTDLGGKKFIDKAREIIGNDVITLFLAYNIDHLEWIKDYKNAVFSNEPKFYKEYLRCFEKNSVKKNLESLIYKMEKAL